MRGGFVKGTTVLALMAWPRFGAAADNTTFTYDALGRLVAVSEAGGPNAGVQTAINYDPAGNRSSYSVSGGLGSGATFSIDDASVTEGGSAIFTVSKSGAVNGVTSVNFNTSSWLATSPSDFVAASGKLTFAQSETSKTISVQTVDDSDVEGDQAFKVSLSSPSVGSGIGRVTGTGTIIDNDSYPPPTFSVSNADAVIEGNILRFFVTKSGPTSSPFSVNYSTLSGSATAGNDFTPSSGTLTFTPSNWTGPDTKVVEVATINDGVGEPDETLYLVLSSATGGAVINGGQAAGTILASAAANSPPVAVADAATLVRACVPRAFNVIQNDTDPDGDSITLLSATTSSDVQIGVIGGSISIQYVSSTGTKTITYTIRDSKGATAQGVLTLTVTTGFCQIEF